MRCGTHANHDGSGATWGGVIVSRLERQDVQSTWDRHLTLKNAGIRQILSIIYRLSTSGVDECFDI